MTEFTLIPLGRVAMVHHRGELGPRLGIDPATNCFAKRQKFFGIERHTLYVNAMLGLVFQIRANGEMVFLDGRGLDVTLANLAEPVIIGRVRPQYRDAVYRHGILLSLVSGSPTIAGRDVAANRARPVTGEAA
jgi:hypothetical protein